MVKFNTSYERTNHVKLPEGQTKLDLRDPVQASAAAAVIRANKTGDYENAGNALALAQAVRVVDNTTTESTLYVTEYEFANTKNGNSACFPTMEEGLALSAHDPDWQFNCTVKTKIG